jgi:hypothetical protein
MNNFLKSIELLKIGTLFKKQILISQMNAGLGSR